MLLALKSRVRKKKDTLTFLSYKSDRTLCSVCKAVTIAITAIGRNCATQLEEYGPASVQDLSYPGTIPIQYLRHTSRRYRLILIDIR